MIREIKFNTNGYGDGNTYGNNCDDASGDGWGYGGYTYKGNYCRNDYKVMGRQLVEKDNEET